MAGKLGRFQTITFRSWKGITKENHIGSIFRAQPQKASNVMVQLLARQYGKTLDTLLSQFPVREFESDEEYTWDLLGNARRNIALVEARDCNGNVVTAESGNIGIGTEPFYLVFDEDYFADGEVIVGNLNQVYPQRILGDGVSEGTRTVYKVELMGGISTGIPAARLLAGERYSVDYAPVERELSRKVGDVRFATPASMRNEFSVVRIQHKVSGQMLDKKLACGIPVIDKNGKKTVMNTWMHYVDYEVETQFAEYKNNILAYGVSNRNQNGEYMNIGKSGEVIRMGDGLFAQMEAANTFYYNHFSLKLLEDALFELGTSKLELGDRYVLIKTGERGAVQFHKAIANTVSGWTMFELDNSSVKVVNRVSSPLHINALSAGFQFVEYLAPNGFRVKVEVDPFYDDPVRNKIEHPDGGVANSYRYDIIDFGPSNEPNIFKCVAKNRPELRGYQWGLRNPYTGQVDNFNMSYDEDSAVIHKMATLGICVLDPTKTISLIPAILQGGYDEGLTWNNA